MVKLCFKLPISLRKFVFVVKISHLLLSNDILLTQSEKYSPFDNPTFPLMTFPNVPMPLTNTRLDLQLNSLSVNIYLKNYEQNRFYLQFEKLPLSHRLFNYIGDIR